MGDAVHGADGVGGAHLGAVAQTQTAVGTATGTAVQHRGGLAGLHTLVGGLVLGGVAVTVAGHVGHHVLKGAGLYTQDGADLVGHGLGTGDAQIGLDTAGGQRGGVVVTAGVAAGAAVDAGQTGTNLLRSGVLGNGEEVGDESQQHAQHQGDGGHN